MQLRQKINALKEIYFKEVPKKFWWAGIVKTPTPQP